MKNIEMIALKAFEGKKIGDKFTVNRSQANLLVAIKFAKLYVNDVQYEHKIVPKEEIVTKQIDIVEEKIITPQNQQRQQRQTLGTRRNNQKTKG